MSYSDSREHFMSALIDAPPAQPDVVEDAAQYFKDDSYEVSLNLAGISDIVGSSSLLQWLAVTAELTQGMTPIERRMYFAMAYSGLWVQPQYPVEDYVADFLVRGRTAHGVDHIIVECDGHQFHEKTPEQAQHDKRRDRYMQSLGFIVMRFTGREIVRNPWLCAQEVQCLLADYYPIPDWWWREGVSHL